MLELEGRRKIIGIILLILVSIESISAESQEGSALNKFGYDGYKSACCHTECCCTTCPQGCSTSPPQPMQQQLVPMSSNNRQGGQENGLMNSLTWGSGCICETNTAFSCKVRDPSQPSSYQGPVYPPFPPTSPPAGPNSYRVQPPLPPFPYIQPVAPPYPPSPGGYITPINGSGYTVPSYDCTCEMSRKLNCRPVEPCSYPTQLSPYYTSTAIAPTDFLQSDFGSILSTAWGLIFFLLAILGWLAVLVLLAALIWALSAKNKDKNQRAEPSQARVVPGLPRTRFDNRISAGDEVVDYRQY